jgi:plastocyanin
MPNQKTLIIAAFVPFVLIGCGDDIDNVVTPPANASVTMRDACDSVSFNAALGAGTCTTAGPTTLAAFNAELGSTGRVAAWTFDPTSLTLRVGQAIKVTNTGGEEHTFTEVEEFGGGIVPALNTASGNPTMAPECGEITLADRIKAGASVTLESESTIGVERYQCCIHPWMRATVTVTGS